MTNIVYTTAHLVSITPLNFLINDRPLILILSESFKHSRQMTPKVESYQLPLKILALRVCSLLTIHTDRSLP
jgi:hypothetical protein